MDEDVRSTFGHVVVAARNAATRALRDMALGRRMLRIVAPLALLVVVVVTVFLLESGPRATPLDRPPEPTLGEGGLETPHGPPSEPVRSLTPTQETSDPTSDPEDWHSSERVTGSKTRLVRVVDSRGRPVVGATVTGLSGTHETDSRGEVLLAGFAPSIFVEANRDDLWGSGEVDLEGGGAFTLPVDRTRALRLSTVDTHGRAVSGIELIVRARLVRGTKRKDRWYGKDRWSDWTSGEDASVSCAEAGRPDWIDREVLLSLPFFDAEPIPVTDADLSRGSLVVRLPPGAPLGIRISDPTGLPFDGESLVWLRDADAHDGLVHESTTDDDWRTRWVPLARRYSVTATPMSGDYVPATVIVDGPVRTGRGVEVDVRYGARRGDLATSRGKPSDESELVLRLVRESGRPVRETLIRWRVDTDEPGVSRLARTDGEGELALPIERFVPPGDTASLLLGEQDWELSDDDLVSRALQGFLRRRNWSPACDFPVVAAARVDVTAKLLPGGSDLGDVILREPPVVVTGRVVDPAGEPVAGADVTLTRGTPKDLVLDQTRSDGDGAFALRSVERDVPFALSVEKHRYRTIRVSCAGPSTDLEITLEPTGGVAGRLLFGGLPRDELEVRVVQGRYRSLDVESDRNGEFVVWGLRTGLCAFKVRFRGEFEELVRVVRIEVEAGRLTRDPRLRSIDVAEGLERLTVTVVDEQGTGVAGARVNGRFTTDENGEAVLFTRSLPVDVRAVHVEERVTRGTARINGVGEDVTLVLSPPRPEERD